MILTFERNWSQAQVDFHQLDSSAGVVVGADLLACRSLQDRQPPTGFFFPALTVEGNEIRPTAHHPKTYAPPFLNI